MERFVSDRLQSCFAVHAFSLDELLEDAVPPCDDHNSLLVVELLLNDDLGNCFNRAPLFEGELEATEDMKLMLSGPNETELRGNATRPTRSMCVSAAAQQQVAILACLRELFHVSMWWFVSVRFTSSRAINCPRLDGEYRLCNGAVSSLPGGRRTEQRHVARRGLTV